MTTTAKLLHELGQIRLGVECCVISENQILLQRRRPDATIFPNCLIIPGGNVDQGENLLQAVIREVFEETGISLVSREVNLRYFVTNVHLDKQLVWSVAGFTAHIKKITVPISSAEGAVAWYPLRGFDLKQLVPPLRLQFPHMILKRAKVRFTYGEYLNGQPLKEVTT